MMMMMMIMKILTRSFLISSVNYFYLSVNFLTTRQVYAVFEIYFCHV